MKNIIIIISLFIAYTMGANSNKPAIATHDVLMERDIHGGILWAEDSAVSGLLIWLHDYKAGCTEKYGYVIPSDQCIDKYYQITGEYPVINRGNK